MTIKCVNSTKEKKSSFMCTDMTNLNEKKFQLLITGPEAGQIFPTISLTLPKQKSASSNLSRVFIASPLLYHAIA